MSKKINVKAKLNGDIVEFEMKDYDAEFEKVNERINEWKSSWDRLMTAITEMNTVKISNGRERTTSVKNLLLDIHDDIKLFKDTHNFINNMKEYLETTKDVYDLLKSIRKHKVVSIVVVLIGLIASVTGGLMGFEWLKKLTGME